MPNALTDTLLAYSDAACPIIYVNHYDPHVLDGVLVRAAEEGVKIQIFDNTLGYPTSGEVFSSKQHDLASFLDAARANGHGGRAFIVLFDAHESLDRADVIAMLKRIALDDFYLQDYSVTVFIVSHGLFIPWELSWCVSVIDAPPPDKNGIAEIIREFSRNNDIDTGDAVVEEFCILFDSLDEFQIKQMLDLAYQDGGSLTLSDKRLIHREKMRLIKMCTALEYIPAPEHMPNVGGLEALKAYLKRKSVIFGNLSGAVKFGAALSKGILIAGRQGCGKSLTAKFCASLFEVPLIRLDLNRFIGKDPRECGKDIEYALKLVKIASPCVLWLDETENAFDVAGNGGVCGGVLLERFIKWMRDKNDTAYVIATVSNLAKLKPELLRKGCFDDLFFIDLPDEDERRQILDIHINKRNIMNPQISLARIAHETEGFSGADLEGLAVEAAETAFYEKERNAGRNITTEDFLAALLNKKSAAELMKTKSGEQAKQGEENDFVFANLDFDFKLANYRAEYAGYAQSETIQPSVEVKIQSSAGKKPSPTISRNAELREAKYSDKIPQRSNPYAEKSAEAKYSGTYTQKLDPYTEKPAEVKYPETFTQKPDLYTEKPAEAKPVELYLAELKQAELTSRPKDSANENRILNDTLDENRSHDSANENRTLNNAFDNNRSTDDANENRSFDNAADENRAPDNALMDAIAQINQEQDYDLQAVLAKIGGAAKN